MQIRERVERVQGCEGARETEGNYGEGCFCAPQGARRGAPAFLFSEVFSFHQPDGKKKARVEAMQIARDAPHFSAGRVTVAMRGNPVVHDGEDNQD
jgi:hypothetical protein